MFDSLSGMGVHRKLDHEYAWIAGAVRTLQKRIEQLELNLLAPLSSVASKVTELQLSALTGTTSLEKLHDPHEADSLVVPSGSQKVGRQVARTLNLFALVIADQDFAQAPLDFMLGSGEASAGEANPSSAKVVVDRVSPGVGLNPFAVEFLPSFAGLDIDDVVGAPHLPTSLGEVGMSPGQQALELEATLANPVCLPQDALGERPCPGNGYSLVRARQGMLNTVTSDDLAGDDADDPCDDEYSVQNTFAHPAAADGAPSAPPDRDHMDAEQDEDESDQDDDNEEDDVILDGRYWKFISPQTVSALDGLEGIGDLACTLLHGHVVGSVLQGCGGALPAGIGGPQLSEIAARVIVQSWTKSTRLHALLRADYQGLVTLLAEIIAETLAADSG